MSINNRLAGRTYDNTQTDIIKITGDKLEVILIAFLEDHKKTKEWITPLALVVTISLTLLTANFKDTLGVSKEVWCLIFIIILSGSVLWLLLSIINTYKYKSKHSVKHLIDKIKNEPH